MNKEYRGGGSATKEKTDKEIEEMKGERTSETSSEADEARDTNNG